MAQLRLAYPSLAAQGAEVLVVSPEDVAALRRYWQEHELPFVGLPDPEHRLAHTFGQETKLRRFGRMPALLAIDRAGVVRYARYGQSMRDLASNDELLAVLDRLNAGADPSGDWSASNEAAQTRAADG